MRGLMRRWARSQRLLALLAILLIAGTVASPLLTVNTHVQAFSKMAPMTRGPSSEIIVDGPGGSSGVGEGLQIVLSEGAEQVEATEVITPAPATPLDEAAVQLVVDRLPALETETTDVQEFRLPEE